MLKTPQGIAVVVNSNSKVSGAVADAFRRAAEKVK